MFLLSLCICEQTMTDLVCPIHSPVDAVVCPSPVEHDLLHLLPQLLITCLPIQLRSHLDVLGRVQKPVRTPPVEKPCNTAQCKLCQLTTIAVPWIKLTSSNPALKLN